jgi:hypothetical protein
MERKIKDEVKSLLKMGLPENLAIITACANKGKPELADEYLADLQEEQSELQQILSNMMPLTESIKLQEEGSKVIVLEAVPLPPSMKCDDKNNEITITEN